MVSNTTMCLTLRKKVQNHWIVLIIYIKQVIKCHLGKARSFSIVNFSPEGEIPYGEKIEEKFVVIFLFWKKLHYLNLLAILFEVPDEIFDIIMLLAVFYTENYANGV